MAYEDQLFESLRSSTGEPVNFNFDMSQPGAEADLEKAKREAGVTSDQPSGLAKMGLEEALDLRKIQGQAQGWAGPTVYPDVMPDPTKDYRAVSQTAGYAGPSRPSDIPYDYTIKATPEGVDPGQQNQILSARLPNPSGQIQTVGQLRDLVGQLKGADKDLVESLVAQLTGIDPEARRAAREKEVAGYKQGLPMSAYEQGKINVDTEQNRINQRRLDQEASTKNNVLFNYLADLAKGMGERLSKDLTMTPQERLRLQESYNRLNSSLAQHGVDILRRTGQPVPGGPPPTGQPAPTAAPTASPTAGQPHSVKLENGVTVTMTSPPATTPQQAVPTQPTSAPGSFANSPEANRFQGKAAADKRVMERAGQIARREGYNALAPQQRHIDQARRELRSEP